MGSVVDAVSDFGKSSLSFAVDPFGLTTSGMGIIGDKFFGGDAAKQAAKTQADALERAQKEVSASTMLARSDILSRLDPAMAQYAETIAASQDQLAAGTVNIMDIFQRSTANADQILTNMGVDAQKAILGTQAISSGIPYSAFDTNYTQANQLPPAARATALNNLSNNVQIGGGGVTSQPISIGGGGIAKPLGVASPFSLDPTAQRQTLAATATPQLVSDIQPLPSTTPTATTAQTGFYGAKGQLESGLAQAAAQLERGTGTARGDVVSGVNEALALADTGYGEALDRFDTYSDVGGQALQQEAALAGALGPDAQQAAIDAYIESPGQRYLREQQEQALLRNSAAIGGLGGGNVRTALQEQAMGIASTQQQQYLENLRSLRDMGLTATGAESQLLTQRGATGAEITMTGASQLAQLAQQLGISQAELASMTSQQLANLAQQTGLNLANVQQSIGTNRANLQSGLGTQVAGAYASGLQDISNLGVSGATNLLSGQQNIAQSLANLATQSGTNLANLEAQQGSALATGQYLQGTAFMRGLGDIASAIGAGTGLFNTL